MNDKPTQTQMPSDIKPLPSAEQVQVKGGLTCWCEDKRRTIRRAY
jgi:hypothetical protein